MKLFITAYNKISQVMFIQFLRAFCGFFFFPLFACSEWKICMELLKNKWQNELNVFITVCHLP